MVERIHQFIHKVWLEESMPNNWKVSVLCSVLKKGDSTICANYRDISLFPIAYKVLTGILCEQLKPLFKTLIGLYQRGFRPLHIDQIFTSLQIPEKTHEKQVDTHYIFVDYKAAFDSPIMACVFFFSQCLRSVYL